MSLIDRCPFCKAKLVRPSGPKESPVLILGEFPGWKELVEGFPFVGEAGNVLRKELAREGLDLKQFRLSNLWLHTENKDNEECRNWNFEQAIKEAAEKKVVFLLGSDCANFFIGKGVMEISGLEVVSPLLSSVETIICSPNPAMVLRDGSKVGEVRLAIHRFAKILEKKGIVI
jgi:uracil-DNA glycosylase family 4